MKINYIILFSLFAAASAAADDAVLDSAPAAPTPAETPVSNIKDAKPFSLDGAPGTESDIGSALTRRMDLVGKRSGMKSAPGTRVDYVHWQGNTGYARLVQTADGMDVEGTQVVFTLKRLKGETRVMHTEGRLFPGVRDAGRSALSSFNAQSALQSRLPSRLRERKIKERGARLRWMSGAWRAVREFNVEGEGVHGAVDESGNTVLWREIMEARRYEGTIKGKGFLFDPSAGNTDMLPLEDLAVSLAGGATTYTDGSGAFSTSGPDTGGPFPVGLVGRHVVVIDRLHPNLTVSMSTVDANPIQLLFNPTDNPGDDTAQVNAYYHTGLVHDWFVARGMNPPGFDEPITAYVNTPDLCMACAGDGLMIFGRAGNGCVNFAFDTVIYHEFAHEVDLLIGGFSDVTGALAEGWGDLIAAFVSGQPLMEEGYNGAPGSYAQTADNDYFYDPNGYNEPHHLGQAWSGFGWHLRQNLIASMGESAGIAKAEDLIIPVFWANSPNMLSAVHQVALLDDDDGDLSNGTPHWNEIQNAAARHGLAGGLDFTGPALTIASPSAGATLSGFVSVSGAAQDEDSGVYCVQVSVDGGAYEDAMGTKTWGYILDTTKFSSGPHTLNLRARDNTGNVTEMSVSVTFTSGSYPGAASYSPDYGAPFCASTGSICRSGSLLVGRGSMTGGEEPNQPNTYMGSGTDGSAGSFHVDPSLDSLDIMTFDGTALLPRKAVWLGANIWAGSDFAHEWLKIFISTGSNSSMTYVDTLRPTHTGAQVLSTNITLPSEGTIVVVRGCFDSSPNNCFPDQFNDIDDLIITMAPPALKPVIAFPAPGTVLSGMINISGTITDDFALKSLAFLIDGSTFTIAPPRNDWQWPLDTRDFTNGPHILSLRVEDAVGFISTASVSVTFSNPYDPGLATYNPTYQTPYCASNVSSCRTGPVLVRSRNNIAGVAEPNQPNTYMGACADGAFGTFHKDQSLDSLRVTTLDGGPLANGKLVRVDAEVWSIKQKGNYDSLDLFISTNSAQSWTALNTIHISENGAHILSSTVTLPSQGTVAILRGSYLDGDAPGDPCPSYAANGDRDDLVLYLTPPVQIAITSPASGNILSGAANIAGTASSALAGLGHFEFFIDASSTSSGGFKGNAWNTTFDTRDYRNGPHALEIKAYDTNGGFGVSSMTVRFLNIMPPAISGVQTDAVYKTSATISWNTNRVANSQIEYGTTTAYGSTGPLDPALTTGHRQNLEGLQSSTLYHYRVTSLDLQGNLAVSPDRTFTTIDGTPPAVTLTSPADGSNVGGSVALAATAKDGDSGVQSVIFEVQRRIFLGSLGFSFKTVFTSTVTAPPYQAVWNSTGTPNGDCFIKASAIDNAGNVGISTVIAGVGLYNYDPPVATLTSPTGGSTVHGSVELTATATSAKLNVQSVTFRVQEIVMTPFDLKPGDVETVDVFTAVVTAPPYRAVWNSTGTNNGFYSVTAEAVDTVGNVGSGKFASAIVTLQNDFDPPAVTLTSPAGGSTVGGSVALAATAKDGDSGVQSVVFEVQRLINLGQLIGYTTVFTSTVTAPPYQAVWNSTGTPNGDYRVLARAVDNAGNVGTSTVTAIVSLYNYDPPTVTLTSPAAGSTVHGSVELTATATSAKLNVQSVTFRVQEIVMKPFDLGPGDVEPVDVFTAVVTAPPYRAVWNSTGTKNGFYSVTVEAVDTVGNVGSGKFASANVTLQNDFDPPEVTLTSPLDGAKVGGSVALAATAKDGDSGVQSVVFEVQQRIYLSPLSLIKTVFTSTVTAPPYQAVWNSTGTPNGDYYIMARAVDNAGNVGTSTVTANVSLYNYDPPSVTLTSPTSGSTVYGSVELSATATSAVVGVQSVTFRVQEIVMKPYDLGPGDVEPVDVFTAVVTAPPYRAVWNSTGAENGNYSVLAQAVDTVGNIRSSRAAIVTLDNDTVPPTVSISTPTPGAVLQGVVSLAAEASDNSGVASVVFFADGLAISTVTLSPYRASWNTLAVVNGTHTLTAAAWDISGQSSQTVLSVRVSNPDITSPSVTLTPLAENSDVAGTVTLLAAASDAGSPTVPASGVTGVQFKLDGVDLGAEVTVPPYAFVWHSTGTANGSHVLLVSARDAAGNVSEFSRTVTVNNANVDAGDVPAGVKAAHQLLSPGLADGINDEAVFGEEAESVQVFDVRGHAVFEASRGGSGRLAWNCRDGGGRIVDSGVYVVRIRSKSGGTTFQTLVVAR